MWKSFISFLLRQEATDCKSAAAGGNDTEVTPSDNTNVEVVIKPMEIDVENIPDILSRAIDIWKS